MLNENEAENKYEKYELHNEKKEDSNSNSKIKLQEDKSMLGKKRKSNRIKVNFNFLIL